MSDQLVINLFEQPIEDGEFRTKNSSGKSFRPNLVNMGTQLHTKVDIVGITNGGFAGSDDLATLLIFEMHFVATGGRRFKTASATFTFEDSEKNPNHDPVVHAISPDGQWALNKTDKVQNVKWDVNSDLKAGTGPVGLEAGVHWETERVKSREFYTKLTGMKKLKRKGNWGQDNVVSWILEENEDKADGLPTFMRAAVLLRRPFDVPFNFTVEVRSNVDFAGKVKRFLGQEMRDYIDPVEIDQEDFLVAAWPTVKSLDPKVHNLEEMNKLDLKEVAGVEVVTLLDGGELKRR